MIIIYDKKRTKEIGKIEIPHSVFVEALKVDGD
jgi:hypothetical protein